MDKIFTAGVSLERVNPIGLGLMAVAVLVVVFAGKLSRILPISVNAAKLIGAVICAAGALLAILG